MSMSVVCWAAVVNGIIIMFRIFMQKIILNVTYTKKLSVLLHQLPKVIFWEA